MIYHGPASGETLAETFSDEKQEERMKEELMAADAAMFDVRCLRFDVKARKRLIRKMIFQAKESAAARN